MALEMVGREVQPDRDVGAEAARQIELVGRHFEHVGAPLAGRLEIERGAADIAADGDRTGDREHVAEQRRRRRLAVGAGDRDEAGAAFRLAPQKLDVADDLDLGALRELARSGAARDG